MTDRPEDSDPTPEQLAAEYALGLLVGDARRSFEARLRDEPELVRAVADWQARFAALAEDEVAPVAPPARVEAALEGRLFAMAAAPSIWQRVALWRALTAAATAVALGAVAVDLAPLLRPPPAGPDAPAGIPEGTILMTHLIPVEGSGLGLAVTREPDGVLQVRRVAGGPTTGRAQELWLIPGNDAAPISLGLLDEAPLTTLRLDPAVDGLFGAGAALAISDEPEGGSPTGAPTGPILALGSLVAL